MAKIKSRDEGSGNQIIRHKHVLSNYLLFGDFKWFHVVTNNFEFFFEFESFSEKMNRNDELNYLCQKNFFRTHFMMQMFQFLFILSNFTRIMGKRKKQIMRVRFFFLMRTLRFVEHGLRLFPIHLHVLSIYVLPETQKGKFKCKWFTAKRVQKEIN